MKAKLLLGTVLTLCLLSAIADEIYACTTPPCSTPGKPDLFSPSNNATCQNVDGVLLSWENVGCDLYYIYIDTFSPPTTCRGFTIGTSWNTSNWQTLAPSTIYYWRIKSRNFIGCVGPKETYSDTWSFSTRPGQASNPNPAHNATDIGINTDLSWTAGAGATSHDVYLGTNYYAVDNADNNSPEFKSNQVNTTFDPGTLNYTTTYYWRVDEKNNNCVHKGQIWKFATPNVSDEDGDGLPYWWEVKYGLDPNKFDAYDDADEDGYVNILEYQFGTDPSSASSVPANVIVVEPNETTNSLQQAINGASNGKTIVLMPGTYASPTVQVNWPTNEEWANFCIDDKNITLRSLNPSNPDVVASTILTSVKDGDYPIIGLYLSDTNSVVQGLTFSECSLAVRCISTDPETKISAPVISDCCFVNNNMQHDRTPEYGGLYDKYRGAGGFGVTRSVPTVIRCVFSNNKGQNGGAVTIHNGSVYGYISVSEVVSFIDCVFTDNQSGDGAAAYCHLSLVDFRGCVFSRNLVVYGGGGGAYSNCSASQFENCVFTENKAQNGGAVYATGSGYIESDSVNIQNCTIIGNTADCSGGALYVLNGDANLANTILWGDEAILGDGCGNRRSDEVYGKAYEESTVTVHFRCCDVNFSEVFLKYYPEGEGCTGCERGTPGCDEATLDDRGGNINVDPCFVLAENPAGLDCLFGTDDDGLMLRSASPCVDKGDNSEAPMEDSNIVDILGCEAVDIPYVGDGLPAKRDIGAYEVTNVILFVKQGASGTKGLSWDDAFGNLQDVLGRISLYDLNNLGLEIWVAQGTYKPDQGTGHTANERDETFQLVSGVSLYGGFCGKETYRHQRDFKTYETILSGEINVSGDANDNSYHVITGADNLVLDGFAITGGNARNDGHYGCGGGMYNVDCSLTVRNCKFYSNQAYHGGGAYFSDTYPAFIYTVENCIFQDNSAYSSFPYGDDGNNLCDRTTGGAIKVNSPINIVGCTFTNNMSYTDMADGGAIDGSSDTKIQNSIFVGNYAVDRGGAVRGVGSITNCAFIGNHSGGPPSSETVRGGAVDSYHPLTAKNCVFVNNLADFGSESHGAVYCSSEGEFINCTFFGDRTELTFTDSPESSGQVKNCIFYGNGSDNLIAAPGSVTVEYSNVHGGYPGRGNIDVDPYFVDVNNPVGPDGKWFTDDDGLRLMVFDPRGMGETVYPGSCIDSADMKAAPKTDICGRSRMDVPYLPNADDDAPGQYADMGAYEMPTVWYVNAYNSYPSIGSSWWCSMNDLQEAIAKAKDGEEIWVAEGEYKPGVQRTDTFYLDKDIKLYGGFAGYEFARHKRDWNRYKTILSGNVGGIADYEDNSYQVVKINSADVVLDGFVVENGYGYESNGNINFNGAGIYMQNSSSSISNCIFRYNCAGYYGYGGAMYIYGGAPTIVNCSFVDNYYQDNDGSFTYSPGAVSERGGGIYVEKASPVIKDCLFARNRAYRGGAIYSDDSIPVVANCVFHQNVVNSAGGAMYCVWSAPVLEDLCFLTNCLFAGNRVSEMYCEGGGIYVASEDTALVLSNCTFTCNSAWQAAAIKFDDRTYVDIMNCIFWDNDIVFAYPEFVKVRNCDIEGCGGSGPGWNPYFGDPYPNPPGTADGGGNIDSPPEFVERPEFYDIAIIEYFLDPDNDGCPKSAVLVMADTSKYEIGDVIQYDGDPNAHTVIDVDYIRNEVIFNSPRPEGSPPVHTEAGKQVRIFDRMGNPKEGSPDITVEGNYSHAVDFFIVSDGSKYIIGDLVEYNNDGFLRQVVATITGDPQSWIYFSPTLIGAYRTNVNITNWGKYAITSFDDPNNMFKVEGKTGRLKVAATQAGSSPCIDKGADLCILDDLADLDNDGQSLEEKIPYDIMGVPRVQEIFSDSDANSVDMGAFESGGLISVDQTISVTEDDPCTFDLNIQNIKGGSVTYVIVTEPEHGSLTTTNGIQITYTPDPEYFASANADKFYYKPFDGTNYGELTKVTVQTVGQVSDPPVAVNNVAWLNEGSSQVVIPVLENDYDPDTNTVSLTVVTPLPQNSAYGDETAVDANTKIKYQLTNPVGFLNAGSDSFTYKCQNTEQSNFGTVTVKANYRPRKQHNASIATELEIVSVIDAAAYYSDKNVGQTLQADTIVQQPDRGQAVIYGQDPRYIIYIPDAEATSGYTTSFTYKVKDELGLLCNDSNIATVSVTVNVTKTITDTDKDWIADSDESDILGTDPHKPDSDGDSVYDLKEIADGFDPTNPYIAGYFADPLPYSTCFFPQQNYTVGKSLDGQMGWQVEDGNCVLEYGNIPYYVGFICARLASEGSGTVISKTFEDDGVADNDSNTIVVKLYPVADAEVRVYSGGTTIAGVKFVDNSGDKKIHYWSGGSWHTSSVTWNYDWAGGEPANSVFSSVYPEHNFGLVVKFVTDFSKSSDQCRVFWDADSDNMVNWTQVGTASFSSSIESITKVQFRSGTNYDFYVRGLYINEAFESGHKIAITFPEPQSYVKSRVPVKGWCYGTNMSGYALAWFNQDYPAADYFATEMKIVSSPLGVSDPNGGVLGYWNSGMLPNGSYSLGLVVLEDLCLFDEKTGEYYRLMNPDPVEGIDRYAVLDIATYGAIKNSTFHYMEESDISIPWHGEFPFELRRIYNSGRRGLWWPFLPGWTNNLQVTLTEYADYYESSTCDNKVGGEIADMDKAGLAFGAVYAQYEDASLHVFRHTTGSVDSYESIYTPYPEDNSGSYIKRIVTGDVNEFVDDCPGGGGHVEGSGFSVDYELHMADGSQITFRTIEGVKAIGVPTDANYEKWEPGGYKEYPYYPYGGAVYRQLASGYCDGNRWVFYEPQGEDKEKWQINTSIETKSDRFGNTLYYGWDYEVEYYNRGFSACGAVNWVSTSPEGPDAVNGITICFPEEGQAWVGEPGYSPLYYTMAKLLVNGAEERTVNYEWSIYNFDDDDNAWRLFFEVCTEDKDANRSRYKSYAYRRGLTGLLRGIFNGQLIDSPMGKFWDWPKRTTIIGYDPWDNFAERIDYIDAEKNEGNYKMHIDRWYSKGEDYLETGQGGDTYFPITPSDNYLYTYNWWFFFEAESGNDEDGQCVFDVTDYYRPEDFIPYRTDCTIVNEKGQLRTQGSICLLNNLLIPKITDYNYADVNLPYTPSEIVDTWLDYNCVSNDFGLAGRRIVNEYEQSRILSFGPNNPTIEMYDLVSQGVYDSNEDVSTAPAGRLDDYLIGYTEKAYHNYGGFNFQTETLSYQRIDKGADPNSHEKPVRTEYVYGLHDGTISSNDACNVYPVQEIVLLNENGPGSGDDDVKTTYYEYYHSTDSGLDGMPNNEDDAYALTKVIKCCGGGVTLYDYDINHHRTWVKVGEDEASAVPTERYCYDAIGQLLLRADTYGLVTRYDYDGFGVVVKVRTYRDADALNPQVRSSFEPAVYDEPLPSGVELHSVTIYEYDEQGRRISERTFSFETKQSQGKPDERVCTAVNRTEYLISNKANKTTVGEIIDFDLSGEPIITDHSVVKYGYDGRGLKIWEKNLDKLTGLWWYTDYYYNSLDQVIGAVWTDYEDRDILRAMSRQYHGSGKQAFEMLFGAGADSLWQVQGVTDFKYDVLDKMVQRTVSIEVSEGFLPIQSAITSYYYDSVGNQICVKDPLGNCNFIDYDNANRRICEYFAEPFDTDLVTTKSFALINKESSYYGTGLVRDINSYDYKLEGGSTPVPPGPGKLLSRKEFSYDARSRVTDVNQAVSTSGGQVNSWAYTQFAYADANDGILVDGKRYAYAVATDAESKQTTIVYNEQATPIKTVFPSGQYQRIEFNGDGTLKKKLVFNPAGQIRWINYSYDPFNRLETVTYPDGGGTLSCTYDGIGRNIGIADYRNVNDNIDGSGEIFYEYDPFGQIIAVTEQDGYRIDYSYRADGQKQSVKVTEPGSLSAVLYKVNYDFDVAGRLKTITEPQLNYGYQTIAAYEYDDNGNRSRLTYCLQGDECENAVYTDYGYNHDNLLTGFNTFASGSVTAPAFKLNVTVDGLGRLNNATETLTKANGVQVIYTLAYGYDMLSQLTSATMSNVGGSWLANYVYQKNGDMSSRTIDGTNTSFTYTGNQMDTASGGESFNLDYDNNGNLTAGHAVSSSFVYNWDNGLRSATVGAKQLSLKYDPQGNRIYKSSSETGNRKYIVDIVGDLPVILLELDASDFSVKKAYIYGNSQIITQYDGNWRSGANKYFYLHDRLGSVRLVIDTTASVKKLYTYNPFGETVEQDGTFANAFRFAGQWFDDEIGQYYLRARMYDPHLGRFVGRDPILGDFTEPLTLHSYLYCINNPTNKTDPEGLFAYNLEAINKMAGALVSAVTVYNEALLAAIYATANDNEKFWELSSAMFKFMPIAAALGSKGLIGDPMSMVLKKILGKSLGGLSRYKMGNRGFFMPFEAKMLFLVWANAWSYGLGISDEEMKDFDIWSNGPPPPYIICH